MSLRSKIDEDYKKAIKNKEQDKINTLRLIKSAIKDKDISSRSNENKKEINDPDILKLLMSLIKQRKDSIEHFQKARRDDLIQKEQKEIDIINQYLPNQKSENEIEVIVDQYIKTHNLENLKDIGKLMGFVKKDYPGEVDMGLVGKIAKSKLGN
tara:strand:- start:4359 stop:4820 length:462 start_codon:yes stop_codon:yes gene_type:complete